jgi:hypothetical protein
VPTLREQEREETDFKPSENQKHTKMSKQWKLEQKLITVKKNTKNQQNKKFLLPKDKQDW